MRTFKLVIYMAKVAALYIILGYFAAQCPKARDAAIMIITVFTVPILLRGWHECEIEAYACGIGLVCFLFPMWWFMYMPFIAIIFVICVFWHTYYVMIPAYAEQKEPSFYNTLLSLLFFPWTLHEVFYIFRERRERKLAHALVDLWHNDEFPEKLLKKVRQRFYNDVCSNWPVTLKGAQLILKHFPDDYAERITLPFHEVKPYQLRWVNAWNIILKDHPIRLPRLRQPVVLGMHRWDAYPETLAAQLVELRQLIYHGRDYSGSFYSHHIILEAPSRVIREASVQKVALFLIEHHLTFLGRTLIDPAEHDNMSFFFEKYSLSPVVYEILG